MHPTLLQYKKRDLFDYSQPLSRDNCGYCATNLAGIEIQGTFLTGDVSAGLDTSSSMISYFLKLSRAKSVNSQIFPSLHVEFTMKAKEGEADPSNLTNCDMLPLIYLAKQNASNFSPFLYSQIDNISFVVVTITGARLFPKSWMVQTCKISCYSLTGTCKLYLLIRVLRNRWTCCKVDCPPTRNISSGVFGIIMRSNWELSSLGFTRMKLPPISWLPRIVAGVAMVYLSMSSALIVADFILRSAKGSSESSESISSFVLCNRYTWSFPSLPNVQQYVSHVLRQARQRSAQCGSVRGWNLFACRSQRIAHYWGLTINRYFLVALQKISLMQLSHLQMIVPASRSSPIQSMTSPPLVPTAQLKMSD